MYGLYGFLKKKLYGLYGLFFENCTDCTDFFWKCTDFCTDLFKKVLATLNIQKLSRFFSDWIGALLETLNVGIFSPSKFFPWGHGIVTSNLGYIGSAVLTLIGYRQTIARYIYRFNLE